MLEICNLPFIIRTPLWLLIYALAPASSSFFGLGGGKGDRLQVGAAQVRPVQGIMKPIVFEDRPQDRVFDREQPGIQRALLKRPWEMSMSMMLFTE